MDRRWDGGFEAGKGPRGMREGVAHTGRRIQGQDTLPAPSRQTPSSRRDLDPPPENRGAKALQKVPGDRSMSPFPGVPLWPRSAAASFPDPSSGSILPPLPRIPPAWHRPSPLPNPPGIILRDTLREQGHAPSPAAPSEPNPTLRNSAGWGRERRRRFRAQPGGQGPAAVTSGGSWDTALSCRERSPRSHECPCRGGKGGKGERDGGGE